MYSLSMMVLVVIAAFLVDLGTSGFPVAITPAVKQEILRQHAVARYNAWSGNTKLPKIKSTTGKSWWLTWDATLAASAQRWANTCSEEHSTGNHGENLYWGFPVPTANTAKEATPLWVDEIKYYTFAPIGASYECQSGQMCGHYTQAIWANTQKIGCAISNCASSPVWGNLKSMVVCQYYPPGNYGGQYPYERADDVPIGEVNIDNKPNGSYKPVIPLNIIIVALFGMMVVNIACLIYTVYSKRNEKSVEYQSVSFKEIEV